MATGIDVKIRRQFFENPADAPRVINNALVTFSDVITDQSTLRIEVPLEALKHSQDNPYTKYRVFKATENLLSENFTLHIEPITIPRIGDDGEPYEYTDKVRVNVSFIINTKKPIDDPL